MKRILFFVIVFSCFQQGYAQHIIVDSIISVYDGDTFRVNINSYPDIIGKNMPIRIAGIDAPEIRGKCEDEKKLAIIVRDYVRKVLFNANKIELRNIERGKYFRIVAEVWYDDIDLAEELLNKNYAYKYGGGKKEDYWCK